MGKKKSISYEDILKIRETYISRLSDCASYESLVAIENDYERDKKAGLFIAKNISLGSQFDKVIGLDNDLDRSFREKKAQFKAPVQPVSEVDSVDAASGAPPVESSQASILSIYRERVLKNKQRARETFSLQMPPKPEIAEARRQQIAAVTLKLQTLEAKSKRLLDKAGPDQKIKGYADAARAAAFIHRDVLRLAEQFVSTGDLATFKRESTKRLDKKNGDVCELEKHRGWKAFLGNLLICITVIGAAYTAYKGCFFAVPFATKSSEAAKDIRDAISQVAAPSA